MSMDCDLCGGGDTDTDILVRFEPYDEVRFYNDKTEDSINGAYLCYHCAFEVSLDLQEKIAHQRKLRNLKTEQFTIVQDQKE